jgi:O-antigen ligase
MASTRQELLRAEWDGRHGMEITIAVVAAAAAAFLVVEPASLVLALCIPMALLAFLNFNLFVYAMVFFLPWYPFIDWKLPVRDVFLLGRFVLFGGVWVLQRKNGVTLKEWLWEGRLRKGIVLFAAIAVISLLISGSRASLGPYKAVGKLASYVAFFFCIAGWARSRDRIRSMIKTLLVSTVGVALFGFYQAWEGGFTDFYFRLYPAMEEVFAAQSGWSGRITSFLFHYNSLAGYLNAVMAFALGVAVLAKNAWTRWLGVACLATSGAALFLTSSRGGMVACGALLLFSLLFLLPRRRTLAIILASALLAASIAVPLALAAGAEAERLQTVDDFTQASRLALWGAAGIIFMQHPVMGAGFGTFRFDFHQFVPGIKDDLDAHNLYLQTLAETGILGFIVFFISMWMFFRSGFRLLKNSDPFWRMVGFGVCGALGVTMVHGMVDYIFIVSPQFGNLFWLVLGIGLVAADQATSEALAGYSEAGGDSAKGRGATA